jgi:Putative Flp pilus-assembly TadE/G-like
VNRRRQRGQVLVLFAGAIIGFVALAALAVDVAMVYSLQQTEKTAADAAALAGAQDLQIPGTRNIDSDHQVSAVQDALDNLRRRFGATGTATTTAPGSNCTPTAGSVVSITDCALVGTPYWVTIKTPSPSAVDVAPSRAVQVTVRNPDVPLTFARVFGQHDWNVAKTSVAGIAFGGSYAIVALRTPVSGRTGNIGDITINSNGGEVNALSGDIGMNTGDVLNGRRATVQVSDGFYVHYYGSYNEQATPPGPSAYLQAPALIPDPFYMVPTAPSGTPTYTTDDTNPDTGAQDVSTSTVCSNATAQAVTNGYPTVSTCYKPGVYNFTLTIANKGTTDLLEPGVYWFNLGLSLKGNLIGGVQANSPGVALVIPQESGPSCGGASSSCFIMNGGGSGSANVLALNRGAEYTTGGQCGSTSGSTNCATAALMPDGVTKVQTNTHDPLPLSVIVAPDPSNPCPVTVPAPSCGGTTINWAGAGGGTTILSISGVVYAPSDNVAVTGSGDPKGFLGQMWTWTATYSGSATLNQYGPGTIPNGSVRLDEACSGGTSPCAP